MTPYPCNHSSVVIGFDAHTTIASSCNRQKTLPPRALHRAAHTYVELSPLSLGQGDRYSLTKLVSCLELLRSIKDAFLEDAGYRLSRWILLANWDTRPRLCFWDCSLEGVEEQPPENMDKGYEGGVRQQKETHVLLRRAAEGPARSSSPKPPPILYGDFLPSRALPSA